MDGRTCIPEVLLENISPPWSHPYWHLESVFEVLNWYRSFILLLSAFSVLYLSWEICNNIECGFNFHFANDSNLDLFQCICHFKSSIVISFCWVAENCVNLHMFWTSPLSGTCLQMELWNRVMKSFSWFSPFNGCFTCFKAMLWVYDHLAE